MAPGPTGGPARVGGSLNATVPLVGLCDVCIPRSSDGVHVWPVLLVAVGTAVTRWQTGARRDDQFGSPLGPSRFANLVIRKLDGDAELDPAPPARAY
jgi:hypothetical protein